MQLQIIGAGLGRTGTKSLKLALEKLGYNKCYHMEELIANPEGVAHWKNALENKAVDWDSLFEGYQACVDFPGAMYYQKLFAHYPDAKVILTVRDPERWYQSILSTIYSYEPDLKTKLSLLVRLPFSKKVRNFMKVMMLNDRQLWKTFFEGKMEDKAYAIGKFQDHNDEVKQVIPAGQLLVYEVRSGWEPLCNFLGKPVPDEPFPKSNTREDFGKMAQNMVKEILG